jgi:rfaE bifunctional protein nucleotidyltransferase chain/domain/rfaE bifunctional protein kinase chain/domain
VSAPGDPVVVLGDALLDRDLTGSAERLSPEAPVPVVETEGEHSRPGGAGMAAVLAADSGRPVVLVTALGDDEAGERVRTLLTGAGVEVVDVGLAGATPEKTRVIADGQLLVRLDRGGGAPGGAWPAAAEDAVASAAGLLVSDYGRGVAALPAARGRLAAVPGRVPVVWDPHPRGPHPVAGARLVTPNRREAAAAAPEVRGSGLAADAARACVLAERWEAGAVAVTRGTGGAVLWSGEGPPLAVPALPATGDPCGAGDRFAATATRLLADGALPSEAVTRAVADASLFIAAGGAAGVGRGGNGAAPSPAAGAGDASSTARQVRAAGGVVVAAGGCFDLLHAGHVRLLEAARALGDCLVVCLNSDASVRRLKGPGRPVVAQHDRAAVLLGLGCVDAVAIFDDDTPAAVLETLRPHLFVKGGDYGAGDLPEAQVLAGWGGQAVVVPYLQGRSTTSLLAAGTRALRTTPSTPFGHGGAAAGGDPSPAGPRAAEASPGATPATRG